MNTDSTARTRPGRGAAVGLSLPDLTAALHAGADPNADWGYHAGVVLLIEHDYWTRRTDFRRHLELDRAGVASVPFAALAGWIDTDPAACRASSSETAMLRLACSLAGHGPAEDADPFIRRRWLIRDLLRPLGAANARLAVEAFTYATFGREVL